MLNGNKKEQITATQNNMMNLIDIILSKRSKKQVYVLYDFIYMKLKKRQKIIDGQNRAGGGAGDVVTGKGYGGASDVLYL